MPSVLLPSIDPFIIRGAIDSDLPLVLAIEQSVHSHPWKQSHFESSLHNKNLFYVVEIVNESKEKEIVGYGIISFGGGESELLNIAVAKQHQGKSIATMLLNFLVDQVRECAEGVFLEVRESNLPAQQLYEKLGFNQVGVRPNYYPASSKHAGGREDAFIFALTIFS
ncbi:MAG: ribosomal protein S18-alanine N-acetyltransferase [Cellvibrionaceae bacterium]